MAFRTREDLESFKQDKFTYSTKAYSYSKAFRYIMYSNSYDKEQDPPPVRGVHQHLLVVGSVFYFNLILKTKKLTLKLFHINIVNHKNNINHMYKYRFCH